MFRTAHHCCITHRTTGRCRNTPHTRALQGRIMPKDGAKQAHPRAKLFSGARTFRSNTILQPHKVLERRSVNSLSLRVVCSGKGKTVGDEAGGSKLGKWIAGTFRSNEANKQIPGMRKRQVSEADANDQRYAWWWVLPLQPYALRKTIREELVPGRMWSFEQPHGAINIVVNIRMTVLKLRDGGLWLHAPIAPTRECLRMLGELESTHGKVRFIVHPTYAVEHKVFVGRFSRAFPDAEVWVAPGQWSWPLNLPISWLGVFPRQVHVIGREREPWKEEIVHATLSLPLKGVSGNFVEVVFLHKETSTLIVTDILVCPPSSAPRICEADPSPLILMQRDRPGSQMRGDEEGRRIGWMKTVLLALYLRPDAVQVDEDGGFEWQRGWEVAFQSISDRVIVPPILRKLVLNRYPAQVLSWVETVAAWDFLHVVSAHFSAQVPLTSDEFRKAFHFLHALNNSGSDRKTLTVGEDQCSLLNQVDAFLVSNGLAADKPPMAS